MTVEVIDMGTAGDKWIEIETTIDFLRNELWIRGLELWETYELLYDAIVLLASCESCNGDSLPWLKNRVQSSQRGRAIAQALKGNDERNTQLLNGAGIDLACWGRRTDQTTEGRS